MLKIDNFIENLDAKNFVEQFINNQNIPKYIFGRNEFAISIAEKIKIDGFIDDFTTDNEFMSKPIISIENVPSNALVVISGVKGKPLIAEKRVRQFQFRSLDYYSFYKYSNLEILKIDFWDGFEGDFRINKEKYINVYNSLYDQISKNQFYNLINFRLSYNLYYMRGFSAIEDKEYFENFLIFSEKEVFIDAGGFDGYTSQEFIRLCPNYKSVHFFEPEPKNLELAKKNLKKYENINYYKLGLSDKKETLYFDISGSSSKISETGDFKIEVNKLDDLIKEKVTFIKMDIEGAEGNAIKGASRIIKEDHPKLAISVYHKADDFWKIKEQIFSIRNDYNIYLRHYTEGISETVMFFIPK